MRPTISMILTLVMIMGTLATEAESQANNTMIVSRLNQCQKLNTILTMMTLGITVGLTVAIIATLITVGIMLIRNSKRRTYHIPSASVRKYTADDFEMNTIRINEYEYEKF